MQPIDPTLTTADPGWSPSLRRMPPVALLARGRHEPHSGAPIVIARSAYLAFVTAMPLFLFVLTFILPWTSSEPTGTIVYILLGAGAVVFALSFNVRRRMASCPDPARPAGQFVSGMFLTVACVEAAGLLGFVAAFLAEAIWPYAVGMTLSLIGFAVHAPTASRLAAIDEQLAASGCPTQIRPALYGLQQPSES